MADHHRGSVLFLVSFHCLLGYFFIVPCVTLFLSGVALCPFDNNNWSHWGNSLHCRCPTSAHWRDFTISHVSHCSTMVWLYNHPRSLAASHCGNSESFHVSHFYLLGWICVISGIPLLIWLALHHFCSFTITSMALCCARCLTVAKWLVSVLSH